MSYLKQLSEGCKRAQDNKPSSFSLMKMFKKPNAPLISDAKEKQEHPYIQDFKKLDQQKKKEMEEKMNEAKMTPEEKRLKQRLSKDKKLFVRIENGKETRFKEDAKGKGFAQVVDVSWNSKQDKQKEKQREKNQQKEKQRQKYREKQQLKQKERIKTNQQLKKQTKEVKTTSYQEKPRIKDDKVNRHHRKQIYSRPAQEPRPTKKYKRSYSQQQDDQMDDFLDSDEDGKGGIQLARKLYGKYYDDKYTRRDHQQIRESTFDEVVKEEKVSKAYALKDQMEDMQYELRRKQQKRRRMKQRQREQRSRK